MTECGACGTTGEHTDAQCARYQQQNLMDGVQRNGQPWPVSQVRQRAPRKRVGPTYGDFAHPVLRGITGV